MCKMFIYGGCRGNKNNYLFEEHCWSQCTGDGEITKEPGDAGARPSLPLNPSGSPPELWSLPSFWPSW
uniref:KP-Den-3 n=1 Tax=Denisonia devisi TaxID=529689 RepID=R4G7G4_DENDV